MPARKLFLVLTLLLILTQISSLDTLGRPSSQPLGIANGALQPSPVESALSWLTTNMYPNGSYGQYLEGQAAPAAYALWLNSSESPAAKTSLAYLAGQLDNSISWFWPPYGEADIPGEVLATLALSQHLSALTDLSGVSSKLLQFQQSNGGFEGYYDTTIGQYGQTVTSSVDTALALWALTDAGQITDGSRTAAVNYLLTLQNKDGSFNLTSTIASNSVESLGPDKTSTTALVILALRDSGFRLGEQPITHALSFLAQNATSGFRSVFAASLSALAFFQYYDPRDATTALSYLVSQQNLDGGFSDANRSHPFVSNALDTGWAAIALQYGVIEHLTITGPLNRAPTAGFTFSPQEPKNGTMVSFDAGPSSDPDGDSLAYSWTFGDGGSASGPTATHVFVASGVYTVTLTVTDSGRNPDSLSNSAWQEVSVQLAQGSSGAGSPASQQNLLLWVGFPSAVIVLAGIAGYLVFRKKGGRLRK